MGFNAQTGFGLAEQAVALGDALEGRHQLDEQNDVLWSRLWWRWELNLFLHKEKALPHFAGNDRANQPTMPRPFAQQSMSFCTIVPMQILCQESRTVLRLSA